MCNARHVTALPAWYSLCRSHTLPQRLPTSWVPCRPEINVRHTAFKRGIAYLERYCLLIAFASFLARVQVQGPCSACCTARAAWAMLR